MKRYRSALGRRDLRRLLGALLISMTGSWAYNVALLAFIFARTHSLAWVGAAGLGRFLPQLVASAYGGVLAERLERIRLMVTSDLLCGACQVGLAVLAAAGGPPLVAILLAGLTAVFAVVYAPATAASIPSLVDEDDLAAANALNSTIEQLVVIAGPAVGALLIAVTSPAVVFAVNAGSFLASAVIVRRIGTRSRPVDVTEGGSAGPLRQMAAGARAIVSQPAARTLVAFSVLVSFVYGTDTVLFVGVSAQRLGTGTQGFGYLLAGLGLGGILMAPVVDRLAGSARLATVILIGALGYCLPTALLTVIHAPWLAFVVQIFRGGSTLVVDVLAVTALQRAVDQDKLARVFGVFFAFVLGAIALGTLITPAITSGFGLNTGLWTMAVAPAAAALAGFPALLAIDRSTASRARELQPKVHLLEALGLFTGATRPMLERLAGGARTIGFEGGATIIREGDPAETVYVLAEGEVEVSAQGEAAGAQRPIRVMRAPAYFGEIGVLEGIPRTATVRALGECRCEAIAGADLVEALTAAPPSTSLMENARSRLAITHPSRRLTYQASSGGR
jgi:CRP-like cAMP-binding protein/predicted MFS family arabinose efflux permease